MNETLWRNALFNPWMAVPISVTVKMPMTIPSVVSTERILFPRIAPQEMRRPSLSSVNKFMKGKSQIPNPKSQTSSKSQGPKEKILSSGCELLLCDLRVGNCLGFGTYDSFSCLKQRPPPKESPPPPHHDFAPHHSL